MADNQKRVLLPGLLRSVAEEMGYRKLKAEQEMVITAFVEGKDVFACLPTGFGKSLCYYCLPALFDSVKHHTTPWSIVIVVSPLHALMQDQVEALTKKGVSAICVLGHEEKEMDRIVSGDYRLIFTTPEVLLTRKDWRHVFQSSSVEERLVGIIVDEAHCVKTWYVNTITKTLCNTGSLYQ